MKKVKLSNLSEKEVENSVNEVRILASIRSPSVVSYKEAFLEGKNLWYFYIYPSIVMEFADGSDLYQKITEYKKKKRYFNEEEIWRVLIRITKGLKTLHDLHIFHRDLKVLSALLRVPMFF